MLEHLFLTCIIAIGISAIIMYVIVREMFERAPRQQLIHLHRTVEYGLLWAKQLQSFNTINGDYTPSLCIDTSGNIYLAYTTTGLVSGDDNKKRILTIQSY